jgi:hypothetical protein
VQGILNFQSQTPVRHGLQDEVFDDDGGDSRGSGSAASGVEMNQYDGDEAISHNLGGRDNLIESTTRLNRVSSPSRLSTILEESTSHSSPDFYHNPFSDSDGSSLFDVETANATECTGTADSHQELTPPCRLSVANPGPPSPAYGSTQSLEDRGFAVRGVQTEADLGRYWLEKEITGRANGSREKWEPTT